MSVIAVYEVVFIIPTNCGGAILQNTLFNLALFVLLLLVFELMRALPLAQSFVRQLADVKSCTLILSPQVPLQFLIFNS